ncbi:ATP-dependent DNA helicase RecG [Pedobacter sp. CG_S7]|uniref:ATP-binding protein n=1 Tax=Pedobacter sp. CG_S7 TaxID=3143930 RepID=UPI003399E8F6
MEDENIVIEYKSLKKVTTGGDAGIKDLAQTCVCLANAQGGKIFIGIEDKEKEPPKGQKITSVVINNTITKLRSLCYSVGLVLGDLAQHSNSGEFFHITVQPTLKTIATTSDGKIYIRVGNQCQPVRGDEVMRLAAQKDAFQWETQLRAVNLNELPKDNISWFANQIRDSDRVKTFVKQMSDLEIAEHYNLIYNSIATNLGVLWLGTPAQRSRILYPITVQYIVYDDLEKKIRKEDWNDCTLNPKELLLSIEKQAIELTYFDEFPLGLFRNKIRHYDERVIRELLINAIAHKSYTISGDIFIKSYPDRLEISNPGGLPLGITTDNILHSTIRRNPHLINILEDLKLMEGEGSGYDLMYEISSRDSKKFPIVYSDFNTTKVVQYSKILDEEALLLMDFIAKQYQLSQKEFIVLGIVARHKKIPTTILTKELQLSDEDRLRSYVSKLVEKAILTTRGIKKGTEYLINPKLISSSKINIKPTLKTIESHRLQALIEEDLSKYPNSLLADIHKRLEDVPIEDIRKLVYAMVKKDILEHSGGKTYRTYHLVKKNRNEKEN